MQEAFICDAIRTPSAATAARCPRSAPTTSAPSHRARSCSAIRASIGRRSTTSSTAAPTRPARTTATSRGWRCCSPAFRPTSRARRSIGCAARASTRSRIAARAIKSGEVDLMIAGGVESMTRAPFVMPKADSRVLARREDRGHDHRLALRQSADEGQVRHRLDARDGRERGGRLQGEPRRPGRVRAAKPGARGGRHRRRPPRRGDRAGHRSPRRRANPSCSSRTSIRARRRSMRSRSSRASCGRTAP